MKMELKIDGFSISLEFDDEKVVRELLLDIAVLIHKKGVEKAGELILEKLRENYEGQPGWKVTEKTT